MGPLPPEGTVCPITPHWLGESKAAGAGTPQISDATISSITFSSAPALLLPPPNTPSPPPTHKPLPAEMKQPPPRCLRQPRTKTCPIPATLKQGFSGFIGEHATCNDALVAGMADTWYVHTHTRLVHTHTQYDSQYDSHAV